MAEGNNKGFEIDMTYLSDIAGGSEEFMIEMIDIFIEQTPLYFDQLSEAVANQDWKSVGDVAHKIKPTLAFMGIEEAKDIMADIERKARTEDNVSEIPGMFADINARCEDLYDNLNKIKRELEAKL
ncbi:Hpt domain-containing protein [Desertivirga brevis]|uniref:Hpt domain-containing protein n=1 Tax=Desertivirga brevis TaxID=2810310 RepID=UPI001A9698BA|nr:Hpt domain-containing protein [Pedobacter sp. SYSU D00873]